MCILREDSNGLAWLTLNHPEKRNALSLALLRELDRQLRALRLDRTIRVVILKANGPVFSAGHDLSELRGASEQVLTETFHLCTQVMEQLPALPQPTLAIVQGLATAAGCQLAASCDLVLATPAAAFATPGVKIGLFCSTPAVPLSRAIPSKRAMEMLLTGEPLTADEALRLGLVNRVIPAERLEAEATALALRIAQASFQVLAQGKQSFYRQLALDRTTAYALMEPQMVQAASADVCQEGINAFFEKRQPVWPS